METKSSFTNSIGFILAAAGSAVGVGNIWRFPYLAANDGGGVFLMVYLVLVLTIGFTLLTTDIAIGRKTKKNAWVAFGIMHPRWDFLGKLTFLVPAMIMTYYTVIGGWVMKYMFAYMSGQGSATAQDGYFTSFITSNISPIVFMLLFLAVTAFVVYAGVDKGIERFSRIVMPGLILMIAGIALFSLTLSHTDSNGTVRTGLQGLWVYLVPNFTGMTLARFMQIVLDAMSQVFFSLSVSMGIMITYGSYVKDDVDLSKAVRRIELFDTGVALLAGLMVIPTVYVFFGTEGMTSGPGLMFVSLPKVFEAMGSAGNVVGIVFFIMVAFAALTSGVSIMETLVATAMEWFDTSRKKMSLIVGILSAVAATVICMGYNVFYFEITLPNGSVGQLLDVMDYISNSFLMPLLSLLTCILVGWIIKPEWIVEEMEASGHPFGRKKLYACVIRYIAPVLMVILFVTSTGIL